MATSAVVKNTSPMESVLLGKPLSDLGLELKRRRMIAVPAVAKPREDRKVVALVAPISRSLRYKKASMAQPRTTAATIEKKKAKRK